MYNSDDLTGDFVDFGLRSSFCGITKLKYRITNCIDIKSDFNEGEKIIKIDAKYK